MIVNIYTSLNGVGLEKDYTLVRDILVRHGHTVTVSDWKIRQGAVPGDLALHMEVPRFDLFRHCPVNAIIPNAEWFDKKWMPRVKRFDYVLAKTKDCTNIFARHHSNVIHTGFCSEDLYSPMQKRRIMLHVAGQSHTKGTPALIEAYQKNDLPKCFLISSQKWDAANNVSQCGRIPFNDLQVLLNSCWFHICTSEYEGWGHYLHEALGCGAVVITTDSEPMNEFITDKRLLVPEVKRIAMHMTERRCVSAEGLTECIKRVYSMPESELQKIGEQNRESFLQRNADFERKLIKFVNSF